MSHTLRPLTNQHLNDRFESPFALLSQAIKIGRESAKHPGSLDQEPGILNQGHQILYHIARSAVKK